MALEIALIIITLFVLIFASISDFKTREIPDSLNYSLLSIAIFYIILTSILKESFIPLIKGLIGLGIFFIIGSVMYYTKQWGGGDAKLLMPLGVIFSDYPKTLLTYFSPNLDFPLLLSFFINMLLAGSLYGILYSIYLALKNKKNFIKEIKKSSTKNIRYYAIIVTIILIIAFLIDSIIIKLVLILVSLLIISMPVIIIFVKAVERSCMIKTILVKNLTEGDWLAQDIYKKNKLICSSKSLGITKKQIQLLKKLKIKNVSAKEGIPFVPSFLIAFVITLVYGNIIIII